MNNTKHLYIHIPFCKSICTYCNFKKVIYKEDIANIYIKKVIDEIKNYKQKFKTIYIGGGTPNCLSNEQLETLLNELSFKMYDDCEFTIELNPEFISQEQINILKKYNVNRFSVGIQSLNNNILKLINRIHDYETIINAIELLIKNNLDNISCDFIINLPNMNNNDIEDIINFINKYNIKHVSIYCLELKHGSIMDKLKYKIDDDKEIEQLEFLNNLLLSKTNLKQYEISNWSINEQYRSKHNLSYWNMDDWIGIGYGASGYENKISYEIIGDVQNWIKQEFNESTESHYFTILMMGLRQVEGIDLSIKQNNDAFNFYKNKLNENLYIIKNNRLKAKDIYLLNNLLLDIV